MKAGGVLASGGLTAVSGCTESLEGVEDTLGGNEGDSSTPAFAQWLYAPDVVGIGTYAYTHVDVEAVNDHSGEGVSNIPESGMMPRQLLGGDIEGIEDGLSIRYTDAAATGAVAWGSLDLSDVRSDIEGTVEENDSVETATYENFGLFFDESNAVAIAGDDSSVLVTTAEDASPRDILEAMIDARRGAVERLAAAEDDVAAMLPHQSDVAVAYGTLNPSGDNARMFERTGDDGRTIESGGYAFMLDGDSLRRRLIVVTDAPVEDAESFGKTLTAVDQLSDPTYAQDGRVVTVEVTAGAEGDAAQQGDAPPQVTFEFEHDLDAGTVTITHAGGDPIDPSNLELVYETDDPRALSWADRTSGQVETGTSVRFPLTEADQGGQLLVRWSDGDREFPLSGVGVPERTDDGGGDGDSTPPQVAFEFEHDLDAGTVTITHAGGDPIDPSNLELVYETDDPRALSWADRTGGQVEAGSSVSFPITEADQGGQLLVRWLGEDRELTISGARVPERTDGDGGDGGTEAPKVSMDADFDFDSGTVTVVHAGGDTVPADELDVVFLTDEQREIRWSDVSDQSSVSQGDTATVEFGEVDYGGRLILGWSPETVILDSVPIPEP